MKIIIHPMTRQKAKNIKLLKILIDQYVPGNKKEVINRIKKEQNG